MLHKDARKVNPRMLRHIFDKSVWTRPSALQVHDPYVGGGRVRPDLTVSQLEQLAPSAVVGRWLANPKQRRKIYRDIITTKRYPKYSESQISGTPSIKVGDIPELAFAELSRILSDAGVSRVTLKEFSDYAYPNLDAVFQSLKLGSRDDWEGLMSRFGNRVLRSSDVSVNPSDFVLNVPTSLGGTRADHFLHELGHATSAVSNPRAALRDALVKDIFNTHYSGYATNSRIHPLRKLFMNREIVNNEVLANGAGKRIYQKLLNLPVNTKLSNVLTNYDKLRLSDLYSYKYLLGDGYARSLPVLRSALTTLMDSNNSRSRYMRNVISSISSKTGEPVEDVTRRITNIINKLKVKYLK